MFYEDFEVNPRIFRVGEETFFAGKSGYTPRNQKMGRKVEFKLKYVAGSGIWEDGKVHTWAEEKEYPCTFEQDGTFSFSFTAGVCRYVKERKAERSPFYLPVQRNQMG